MLRTTKFLLSHRTIEARDTLRDSLDCLSGSRHKNADPLGKGHEFRQGPNLHFRHHPLAMGLDGALGTTQREGDVLVGVAANDKFKDFPLTRRQCRDMSANDVQPALQGSRHFMMRNRPLDCLKKNIR
jgi:hypothetical protein